MLNIVASYHFMQFLRKLMNETKEHVKKNNLRPNFGSFGTELGPKKFLWVLPLQDVRQCCKKPHFRIDLDPLCSNLGCVFFQNSGFVSH